MKTRSKLLLSFCALVVAMLSMSIVAFATDELQKPGTVTGLKQSDSSTSSVEVEWTADITPNCYYDVELSTTGAEGTFKKQNTYRISSPNYYFGNLSAGTTYYVRVKAFTYSYSAGELYADNYSVTIPVVTAPDGVKNVKQTNATTNSITLSWDNVAGATGYYIYNGYSNDSNSKLIANVTTNEATIKNLKSDNEYSFYVYAYRKAGNYVAVSSSYDYISNYDIKFTPGKVNAKTIDVSNYWSALKEMNINWKEVPRADGYQIQVCLYNKKAVTYTTTASYESVYIKKIQKNRFYKIRVRAYAEINGAKKYGAWSGYTYVAQEPDVISAKQVGSKKQVKVKWDTVKGATNYTVYMSTKKNSGYKKVGTTKKTTLTVSKIGKTKLKKNKTYYVYVVANRKVGKTTYTSGAPYCWQFKLTK